MFSLTVDPASVRPTQRRSVRVRASDLEDLLMSWLNELIYIQETESLVLSEAEVGRLDAAGAVAGSAAGAELEADVSGEPYDPQRHELELQIKACTFNGLVVEPGPPARVVVYFDV